jgi:hypothetical protein
MMRRAMVRRRCTCGLLSAASSFLALASAIIWPYCWPAAFSSSSAGTSLRSVEPSPTFTCATAGKADAAAAAVPANTKARRADHTCSGRGVSGAGVLRSQSRHMRE